MSQAAFPIRAALASVGGEFQAFAVTVVAGKPHAFAVAMAALTILSALALGVLSKGIIFRL